ncbi:aminotransferase class I/II-fold pyridoxal phosphate-dependent enzyme [Allorhodopirellula solitaria]|uniref:8-amino-7-oxononanoate synthase n=1 Tax=Allorhodopirellula solitaria TaxID=2527987 RepID=A0A5C5XN71_9BACT|nr:8-amino-7-oxononanoate synthase [Allorhodopirellula solitaria]TWT64636.1 8-amino-7-oxononanoate synthase [Allorhodopirellula solitaria]
MTDGPLANFAAALEQMTAQGRRRQVQPVYLDGPWLIDAGGQRRLNFGGNDYLGVVADALVSVGQDRGGGTAGEAAGVPGGAAASALVCGWTPHHERLAKAIATAENCEAAVIFPSGYAACSGCVATLCRAGDLILSDELNHASLIDGCRASRAQCLVYPHRDVAAVSEILSQRRSEFNQVWIVTDGVFSMDGDVAPLGELVDLADQHDAQLLVDEAHGTGVLGARGSGLCEAVGLQERIGIRIGTLSKAVGHQGGFVTGPRVVIDYLIQFCRPLIFSTALAPTAAAGACRVIEQMEAWQERRKHLTRLAQHARGRLHNETTLMPCRDWSELESGIPIVPLIVGSDQRAVDLSRRLGEQGYYVPAIRPPTVPEGTARLRLSLSAAHQQEHVDALIDTVIGILKHPMGAKPAS